MANTLSPYITFIAKAQTALEFYKSVFGGDLTLLPLEGQKDLIMHGQLVTTDGMTIMASDDPEGVNESKNLTIAVSGDDQADLQAYWDKLAEGAVVIKQFDGFGILTDKFGIRWMINVTPKG